MPPVDKAQRVARALGQTLDMIFEDDAVLATGGSPVLRKAVLMIMAGAMADVARRLADDTQGTYTGAGGDGGVPLDELGPQDELREAQDG